MSNQALGTCNVGIALSDHWLRGSQICDTNPRATGTGITIRSENTTLLSTTLRISRCQVGQGMPGYGGNGGQEGVRRDESGRCRRGLDG